MSQPVRTYSLTLIAILLGLLAAGVVAWAPSLASGQVRSGGRWNPRRVPVGAEFVGDQACGECHKKLVGSHAQSGMAIAMEPVTDSRVLVQNPQLSMRVGPYLYEIKRNGKQSFYSVTDGKETISLPIVYAMGQGRMGQTYVLQQEGKFYESLVSFYNEPKGLDFTIGAPRTVPESLTQAVGRALSPNDVSACFSCHSTGAVSGGQMRLEKLAHGVRCEACHGPGGPHVVAAKEDEGDAKLIFNPGRLSGDELSQQFCASCHRGSDEFSLLKSMEINNVRFQPYRIFNSKCYSDDRAISCIACHNPHEPLKEETTYYDAKCLACHALKGKPANQGSSASCPVANKDCTSCHMPKIDVRPAHFKFTDHYIRVVKPGEKYPN
jgi:Cytochrome c554 and c-prime